MTSVAISIKRLDPDMVLPHYAYPGDAGMDICSAVDLVIPPLTRAFVPTGIALDLPHGYAAFVLPRSGLAKKQGITILNSPGLIDSNYRGEIGVVLYNSDTAEDFVVKRFDRIAQLLIAPVPTISFQEVENLSVTERNDGGFGSSGVA